MSRREKLEMEITQEHPMSWYRYHRYNDIMKFLEYLQRKYPSSVELIHIGRSFEGRPLIVVKVCNDNMRFHFSIVEFTLCNNFIFIGFCTTYQWKLERKNIGEEEKENK